MEKVISTREWATVKRIAQSVQPMVQKKAQIKEKLQELADEYKMLDAQIQGFEHGIKALCGGLSTEQLVHREVKVLEGKFDKDGRPMKKASFEPNPNVHYDKDKNVWVITFDEEPTTPAEPETPSENVETPDTEAPAETEETTEGPAL